MSIKIGFLAPYSSIYKNLAKDIIDGFYAALPETIGQSHFFELIPEYVKQGGIKETIEASQKLIYFNNVDIVSGLVNYKSVPELIPLIEQRNKLGFFLDMGENIPYNHHISDNVFFNSFQLWQAEYALGEWSYNSFGDKGTVLMSLYDAGYHLQSAFRQGGIMGGSKEMDFSVLHGDPAKPQVTENIHHFFESTYSKFPAYLHAIFCGDEAITFLREFAQSRLNKRVPLVITAHMASEEILNEVSDLSLEMYAASMYNYSAEDSINKFFKENFVSYTGRKPNIFSLLGYEWGQAMLELIPYFEKRDFKTVAYLLKSERINSPRGQRNFYLDSKYALPVIDIEKIKIEQGKITKLSIAQGHAMKYNSYVFDEIHRENVSGWQNPYLCV